MEKSPRIVVVLPAFNEELTIGRVIKDVNHFLPESYICVINNNSKDKTEEVTISTFASLDISNSKGIYLKEYKKGKANAVKKALYSIDADIYIMIDADCTYDISQIRELMQPIVDGKVDMVVGNRHAKGEYEKQNKRLFHNLGNNLVKKVINFLYRANLTDILSGYRVFSRDFVKNFPVLSEGFELETELTLFALENNYSVLEIPTKYYDRPENSYSKLDTFSDGYKVIFTILGIFKDHRPLFFFGGLSIIFFCITILLGIPVIYDYITTGLVGRFPTAFLAMGTGILSALFFNVALILHTIVTLNRRNTEYNKIYNFKKIIL